MPKFLERKIRFSLSLLSSICLFAAFQIQKELIRYLLETNHNDDLRVYNGEYYEYIKYVGTISAVHESALVVK